LRAYLSQQFQIAVSVRTVANGLGHRLYQVRKPADRRLVDVRGVDGLPPHHVAEDVMVMPPAELIRQKVVGMVSRSGTVKPMIDLADIRRLLLAFPHLKVLDGLVAERLRASGAPAPALEAWREIAAEEIVAENDEDGY
jgi:hypothetical protein